MFSLPYPQDGKMEVVGYYSNDDGEMIQWEEDTPIRWKSEYSQQTNQLIRKSWLWKLLQPPFHTMVGCYGPT